jgi:surfeit locus 1 family protein
MLHELPPKRALRSGQLIPALFACAALVLFLGLGTWQIQRKFWKEATIARLEQRLGAAPAALPPPEQWNELDQGNDEFRHVKFSAVFIAGAEALVYATSSTMRSDASGPGYWVFAPARPASGGLVLVNRGFVPEGRQDPNTRSAGEVTGSIDMIGVMRWPEAQGPFTPADRPNGNLWFVRDPVAIAVARGWRPTAPFYIELEAPQPPGGLPHPSPLAAHLRNEHLQYALTWYGLALVVSVIFGLWLRNRRRQTDPFLVKDAPPDYVDAGASRRLSLPRE